MTDSQLLSCMLALEVLNNPFSNGGRGLLLQVPTGEGKSTIIRVLAIAHALKGKELTTSVDIVASSIVLAKRDSESTESKKMFALFDLETDWNEDKLIYSKGIKKCYAKPIVYGDSNQFQFDILRHEFSNLGTLGERSCNQFVIGDEIDSMMIDDSSKIARLSSSIPGMDCLEPIYHLLWKRLEDIWANLAPIGNKLYLFLGTLSFESHTGKYSLEFVMDGQTCKVDDVVAEVEAGGHELSDVAIDIKPDKLQKWLNVHLLEYIQAQVLPAPGNQHALFVVPPHLAQFVKSQLPKWVTSAITALDYAENVHYIVEDGCIKPVDFSSTGVIQDGTLWGDGLHQFLSLKHRIEIRPENLTTDFLSNVTYFKRYKQLLGFTGTLGSESNRNVLQKVYNLDLVAIPSKYKSKRVDFEPLLFGPEYESEWLSAVVDGVALESEQKRATLVICEDIRTADLIASRIDNRKVRLYTNNKEHSICAVLPGEVVVATNLAGRGTDIKTHVVEEFGGLHVILTFLPKNLRVEEQALGRTARQGNCGSTQLIARVTGATAKASVKDIRKKRDEAETNSLNEFQDNQLKEILLNHELFGKFTELFRFVRQKLEVKTGKQPTVDQMGHLAGVEERWALFLLKAVDNCEREPQQCNPSDEEEINQLFEDFHAEILESVQQKTLIQNPAYYVAIANDYFQRTSWFKRPLDTAAEFYEKALGSGRKSFAGSSAALVGKAHCILKNRRNGATYKHEAAKLLAEALLLLNDEMAQLQAIHALLANEPSSALLAQLTQKTIILGSFILSVESSFKAIQASRRLVDLSCVPSGQTSSLITRVCGLERNHLKELPPVPINLRDSDMAELTFNDLTAREDLVTFDQAVSTVRAAQNSVVGYLVPKVPIAVEIRGIEHNEFCDFALANKRVRDLEMDLALEFLELYKEERVRVYYKLRGSSSTSDKILLRAGPVDIAEAKNFIRSEDASGVESFDIEFMNANSDIQNLLKGCKIDVILRGLTSKQAASVVGIQMHSISSSGESEPISEQPPFAPSLQVVEWVEIVGPNVHVGKNFFIAKVQHIQVHCDESTELSGTTTANGEPMKIQRVKVSSVSSVQLTTLLTDNKGCTFDICFGCSNVCEVTELELNDCCPEPTYVIKSNNKTASLIPHLRMAQMKFSIVVGTLTAAESKRLVGYASLEQEHVEARNMRSLAELVTRECASQQARLTLEEYKARGIEFVIEIAELGFVPCYSVSVLAAIALVHVAAGGSLIYNGFGAGMDLVFKGLCEFDAFRLYSSREVNWSSYRTKKAMDLAISAKTVGLMVYRGSFKGAATVLGGVSKKAGDQTLQTGASTALQVAGKEEVLRLFKAEMASRLASWVPSYVATTGEKVLITDGLVRESDEAFTFALHKVKPTFLANMQEKVGEKLRQNKELIGLLAKFVYVDQMRNTTRFQLFVEKAVAAGITIGSCRSSSDMAGTWARIGQQGAQILYGSKSVPTSETAVLKIVLDLIKLREVDHVIIQMESNLTTSLKRLAAERLTDVHVIQEYLGIPLNEAKRREADQSVNDAVRKIVQKLLDARRECDIDNQLERITASVANTLLDQILGAIQAELIQPCTNVATGYGAWKLGARVETRLLSGSTADLVRHYVHMYRAAVRQEDIVRDGIRQGLIARGTRVDELQELLTRSNARLTVANMSPHVVLVRQLGPLKFIPSAFMPFDDLQNAWNSLRTDLETLRQSAFREHIGAGFTEIVLAVASMQEAWAMLNSDNRNQAESARNFVQAFNGFVAAINAFSRSWCQVQKADEFRQEALGCFKVAYEHLLRAVKQFKDGCEVEQ